MQHRQMGMAYYNNDIDPGRFFGNRYYLYGLVPGQFSKNRISTLYLVHHPQLKRFLLVITLPIYQVLLLWTVSQSLPAMNFFVVFNFSFIARQEIVWGFIQVHPFDNRSFQSVPNKASCSKWLYFWHLPSGCWVHYELIENNIVGIWIWYSTCCPDFKIGSASCRDSFRKPFSTSDVNIERRDCTCTVKSTCTSIW